MRCTVVSLHQILIIFISIGLVIAFCECSPVSQPAARPQHPSTNHFTYFSLILAGCPLIPPKFYLRLNRSSIRSVRRTRAFTIPNVSSSCSTSADSPSTSPSSPSFRRAARTTWAPCTSRRAARQLYPGWRCTRAPAWSRRQPLSCPSPATRDRCTCAGQTCSGGQVTPSG